jgi:hypothetical protein
MLPYVLVNLIKSSYREQVEGMGPMKPGNRPVIQATVLIPTEFLILGDERNHNLFHEFGRGF